ncbi:MAG: S-layer homology domain-containing protein [Oscillospiraceae bacterium]|nr:S-layer homology domain-containing protein [Oscillospiraceae bacterium]
MKDRWLTSVICALLLLWVLMPAGAAEPEAAGFYGIDSAEHVEIVPVTFSGETVEAVIQNVDGREGNEVFYPGSAALRVTLRRTAPGRSYLLTVEGSSGILYADQQTAGISVSFLAAFPLPEEAEELTLRVGSDAVGFSKLEIPLFYTPRAEGNEQEESGGEVASPDDPSDTPPEETEPDLTPEEGTEPPDVSDGEHKPGCADCRKGDECPLNSYDDLDAASWYHDGIHWALDQGVMNGVDGQHFAPAAAASRAMLVTMLWRMEGEPRSDLDLSFQDVPAGAWYTEAVRWAASEHIVDGYGTDSFGPNDSVSREQLATILWRFAGYKGMSSTPTERVNLGVFLDAEQISGWAYDAMQWAVDAGLITGVGNDLLSPKTEAGRAQVATVLMRYEGE